MSKGYTDARHPCEASPPISVHFVVHASELRIL